jgi:hypothetical protein
MGTSNILSIKNEVGKKEHPTQDTRLAENGKTSKKHKSTTHRREASEMETIRIYPYGVARNRLMQAAKRLGVPAVIVRDVGEANALVTLRTYYRNRQRTVVDAEQRGMPIYVLRANTVTQIERFLSDLFDLPGESFSESSLEGIRLQTQAAIEAVLRGERWVDLPPGSAAVRRIQHEMARKADLLSHSYGKEPRRHVRIFRE